MEKGFVDVGEDLKEQQKVSRDRQTTPALSQHCMPGCLTENW